MAINTYYRGVAFVKDYLVHYLNRVFAAAEKGQILLTNGYKEIKFSQTPSVVKRGPWDFRRMPVVLVGAASGNYKYMSIGKDLYRVADASDLDQKTYYGGDILLTVSLDIRATTQDERDNLVDIVCLFLAHPDAKDYFAKHAIVIENPPTIGGEREMYEPGIDYPIYATTVSIPLRSVWQISTGIEGRIDEIFLDVEFVQTFTE